MPRRIEIHHRAIFLLFATCLGSYAERLYFDRSHGEFPPPRQMAGIAAKLNLELVNVDETISSAGLQGARVLYLRAPSKSFLKAEKEAIVDFVRGGGSLLLVMDEEKRQSLATTGVNDLLSPFDMRLTPDTPYIPNPGAIAKAGEINRSDRELPYDGGRSVVGGTPFAFQLDKDGNRAQPYAAWKKLETGGRIVVLAEGMASLFLGSPKAQRLRSVNDNSGMDQYWGKDSAIFIEEVLSWLALRPGANVSGKWSGTMKADDRQAGRAVLILKQDDGTLTGTAGPTEDHQLPISDGKVDGNTLTMTSTGFDGTYKFTLTLDGDRLKGGVEADMGGQVLKGVLDVTRATASLSSSDGESRILDSTAPRVQTFPLNDTQDLVESNLKLEAVEYQGRKAVRASVSTLTEGLVLLRTSDFEDGTIEADVAVKVTTPAAIRNPGFIGIAFRSRSDARHFDMFYIRPGNSGSADQAQRNHSAQYAAKPDFDWYKLRRPWPSVYEAYADLQPETWTHLKIEVEGRLARLYVNGAANPVLVVDGLKGEDLKGGVGLWGSSGQENYFSNVRITHAKRQSIENGGEANGVWEIKYATDSGNFSGLLTLHRDRGTVSGTASGLLGSDTPVTGTWRNGYVELAFRGTWSGPGGNPGETAASIAGWIDGSTGKGRVSVTGRADGTWTATRKE